MKVVSILGARPQFIKAAPVSRAFRKHGVQEFLLHTGQHYDRMMSDVFFDQLDLPKPNLNIEIGSGLHGMQTGNMLIRIEEVLLNEKPDLVMVYGDTNSTLAGSLAASKLHIPSAHVEAGLRSFNRKMPEEYNRIIADHCSDVLLCPTKTAVSNLKNEGIITGVHLVGDTMYDAVLQYLDIAHKKADILDRLQLNSKEYLVATIHRPYNTDDPENLAAIISALQTIDEAIIFPIHPRTRKKLLQNEALANRLKNADKLKIIEPVGYLDMLMLEKNARVILTDSGGMQKEAFFLKVPCITLRPETEWIETVEAGWNRVVGTNKTKLIEAVHQAIPPNDQMRLFGDGDAADKIVKTLLNLN